LRIRQLSKPFSFPCRSKTAARGTLPPGERGYVLLVLMIAVALLMISLTAALPNIFTEGQREREEELIFRGNEYARAIGLYHARFNRYPMKIEDLVNATNGIRFLRRAYPDAMTKGG